MLNRDPFVGSELMKSCGRLPVSNSTLVVDDTLVWCEVDKAAFSGGGEGELSDVCNTSSR